MIKSNGGIIGPDNVTTGGAFGTASGVFKLGEVTNLIKESKWPTAGPQGFQVANSCRFDSGSDDHLDKTFAQAGNRKTFTVSFWMKTTTKETYTAIFDAGQDGSNSDDIYFHTGRLNFSGYYGSTQFALRTTAKFRDPGAWSHHVIAFDTTQGTASNRIKIFTNGVQETAFDDSTYPAEDFQTSYMNTARLHNIGTLVNNDDFPLDGYLAEFCFIDGTALDPTSFGEFNSQTGIWVPKNVSGLTFGTNGFYLDFKNSSALGNDVSGNNNDFAMRNLTSLDQSTDTCSTNFATMNPLDLGATTGGEFLQGNLDVHMGGTAQGVYYSTIGVSSGKWYVEVNPDSGSGGNSYIGISGNANNSRGANDGLGDLAFDYGYYQSDGSLRNNDSDSSYGSSYSNGNIIGVYLDLDNNKLYFSVNGTVQNSGTGISISAVTNTPTGNYFFCVGDDNAFAERRFNLNFGSPIESISSSNTDDNGFGNFEYSPNITGDGSAKKFYSLNTKNLTTVLA